MIKNQNNHLVTIVLPVYNNSATLEKCLLSLIKQTYKNIEVIAIDDNSKDNSYSIIRSFRKTDKRIRAYRNVKRYGLAITLNRCLRKSKGKFIAFMNSNDQSRISRIKKQLAYLIDNPKTVAVGSQCAYIDQRGKGTGKSNFPIDNENIIKTLTNNSTLAFESFLINKYLLPKDLLSFEEHLYPFLFRSLFTRMLQFGEIENLDQYLYCRCAIQQPLYRHIAESFVPSVSSWIKTAITSGNPPPIRSIISPLVRIG